MIKLKRWLKPFSLLFVVLMVVVSNSGIVNQPESYIEQNSSYIDLPNPSDVFNQGILYSGSQDALDINETALYTDSSHYTIGNGTYPEYSSQNATFPIDQANGWNSYLYSANITNLSDENDWISNGNFGSDLGVTYSSHDEQVFQSPHPYSNNLNSDPDILSNIITTIYGSGCDFMRVHFLNISTEWGDDTIYLWDQNNDSLGWYSGKYNNITTPWLNASIVKITMETGPTTNDYGYFIDYFETYDGSLFSFSSDGWTAYRNGVDSSRANAVAGHQLNNSAINITLAGTPGTGDSYSYYRLDESGAYQELTIPRGRVTDAWISMDYNVLRGINNAEMILVFKINDQIVYQRGFNTITAEGLAEWHSTGLINMDSWLIQPSAFSNNLYGATLNVSVGVQATKIRTYSSDHADLQEVYIDNITLILQAEVNCTQTEINLLFDNVSPTDSITQWGSGAINLFNTWDTNPFNISLTTDSTKIDFDLVSAIYGTHMRSSTEEEYGDQGSQVIIYSNGSIHWGLYHRAYIPLYYDNYEFSGYKPQDWEIFQIIDPIGSSVSFLNGEQGDDTFSIEHPSSELPGWWHISAQSTNMILPSATDLWNGTDWTNFLVPSSYTIDDTLSFKTALNTSIGNIENNASSWANLTIYDPDDGLWYSEAVHPSLLGEIQFAHLTIGGLNTTGGVYQYSIIWMNGTSAGGIHGSFLVQRNIQASILYPRDAIGDFITEEILGDVIPLRILLNDSYSGLYLSNLNVEYNWSTGTRNLIEISNGIYDGALDTLDLVNPGYHEVNFTVWGNGYYNLSFILQINLVEETELKIVGLDNNIDYGTNFSIEISYKAKPLLDGIPDADIVLNLSSSVYSVTDSGELGKYNIEISSKDAFLGAGSYDIQINASAPFSQTQDLVTRIQVLPRSVYFEIFINSVDVSFNKSYSAHVKQILNISVGVKASSDNQPILSGIVYMTDGQHIHDNFSVGGNFFSMEINSSHFGLGVRFISIIFNETTYQSYSEIIMLSVTRLPMKSSFFEIGSVLDWERNKPFEVLIYVEDPVTHLPITDVIVAYDWIFGRGFLTNLGNGYFKLEEIAPRETGSYRIIFTITSPNVDYEPSTLEFILISRAPETPNLWWILLVVGSIALIATGILGYIAYRRNVLIPKREEEVNLLRKKTQVFDDITNIKSILIIESGTGRLMFQQNFGGLNSDLEDIFSGFLHSILTLSNKFALQNGELGDRQEYAEFTHEAFHVLVASGKKVLIAIIMEEESSRELQERAFKFLDEFEGIYASIVGNWKGDRAVFRDTTPKLFEEIFHLSLLNRFMLSEVQNVHLLEKTLVTPGTVSEKVSQIIKTVSEERHDFRLKTLISLIPKEEQLEAKDIILRFIKNKYLIPV
ncbi:MAG: hypothetical protein EU530_11575 [Promethearchaeota archaeon]|nr:MAG: hypothetical protein EU530_11575 [Candidatus Lokiarchaeota archaeon]